jgi:hypothetical protein
VVESHVEKSKKGGRGLKKKAGSPATVVDVNQIDPPLPDQRLLPKTCIDRLQEILEIKVQKTGKSQPRESAIQSPITPPDALLSSLILPICEAIEEYNMQAEILCISHAEERSRLTSVINSGKALLADIKRLPYSVTLSPPSSKRLKKIEKLVRKVEEELDRLDGIETPSNNEELELLEGKENRSYSKPKQKNHRPPRSKMRDALLCRLAQVFHPWGIQMLASHSGSHHGARRNVGSKRIEFAEAILEHLRIKYDDTKVARLLGADFHPSREKLKSIHERYLKRYGDKPLLATALIE